MWGGRNPPSLVYACNNYELYITSDRGSDRRPNLCKRRRAAAGELYIPQESWPFSSSFFILFTSLHISF